MALPDKKLKAFGSHSPGRGPARAKTVLWIDAHLEHRSPTMKHLLHSLPALKAQGWTVRAWCYRSDAPRDQVEHVFLPSHRWLRKVEMPLFFLLANVYGLWHRVRSRGAPASVVHATCGTYLGANLTSVHFVNALWAKKHLELGFANWKERVVYGMTLLGVAMEWLQLHSRFLRRALCVSDSIASEVRLLSKPSLRVDVLPNSYDEGRFNLEARAAHRDGTRKELQIPDGAIVFCFASTGHYRRKGFWLAVEALSILRGEGKPAVRLLVVGGEPGRLSGLQLELAKNHPDRREWILFTGMQADIEKYYAAADAFLFPSYFEAFCLAEIEAAATGLPLFITPHFGSEMILREGVNGLLLEYDAQKIAAKLRSFVDAKTSFHRDLGRAVNRAEYAKRLGQFYEELLAEEGSS